MIGDPSGKTAERQLLSLEQIDENLKGIRAQLERFLDFSASPNPARIVNNADWLASDQPDGVPARHGEALHRELHAAEGIGDAAASSRRTGSPSRSSAT